MKDESFTNPNPTDSSDDKWPLRSVVDVITRRRRTTHLQFARSLQRLALDRASRRALAHDAQRFATLVGGLSANPALAGGGLLCRAGGIARLLREAQGRTRKPSAAIFDSRTLQSTPEVATMPAMMEPSGAKAARCMRPSIRWATCWLCW